METSTEEKLRHLLKNKKILGIAAVILLIVGSMFGSMYTTDILPNIHFL
mgnify:CR=1 FL=1